jgi:hypothetical protein
MKEGDPGYDEMRKALKESICRQAARRGMSYDEWMAEFLVEKI